jgi:hypothetical protein
VVLQFFRRRYGLHVKQQRRGERPPKNGDVSTHFCAHETLVDLLELETEPHQRGEMEVYFNLLSGPPSWAAELELRGHSSLDDFSAYAPSICTVPIYTGDLVKESN